METDRMNAALETLRFRSLLGVCVSKIQHGMCCLDCVSHYTSMDGENWETTWRWYRAAFIR